MCTGVSLSFKLALASGSSTGALVSLLGPPACLPVSMLQAEEFEWEQLARSFNSHQGALARPA